MEVGERIPFAGFIYSGDGIFLDPERTKAVREFPRPKNISYLRGSSAWRNSWATSCRTWRTS